MSEVLECRMCRHDRFSLYTHPAREATPAKTAWFGLLTITPAVAARAEHLTATCLRCSCEHSQEQIQGKYVRGPLG